MYLFYIDESGNLDTSLITSDGKAKDHIYVLTACGMFEGNWHKFYMDIVSHKLDIIKRLQDRRAVERLHLEECEVKSTYLRNKKERQKSKFLKHLSGEEINEIKNLYYSRLGAHNICICSVVVDKRHLEPYYDMTKLHRKAWELLCERIVQYLGERHPKHKAILIKDDISPQINAELARKHSWFLANKTSASVSLKRLVEMPLFTRSEMNEGLQLADLCAYNVYRAFKYEDFGYEFFRGLLPFFCTSKQNKLSKIDGLKVFPNQSPLVDMAKKISPC